MNRRQRIGASIIAALLVILIVSLAIRARSGDDPTLSRAPTSTSDGTATPTEPAPTTEPTTPVPTTPDEVALEALSGLLAGENATACPMFTPEAYYLKEGPAGPIQEPISTWCPDGEPFGHMDDARNFKTVTSQVTTETARVGVEFELSNGRSRVAVSLVNQNTQWTVDRWCFYTGSYPNGTESMLGCLDGVNE